MNVKNRALFLVSLIIVVLSGFYLSNGISYFNEEIDKKIQEQEKTIDGVTHQIFKNLYNPYLNKIKIFVEQNEQLRQAFADRDRDLLLKLSSTHYQRFNGENEFFHAMDFNLPDGTVFLRVQKPEFFGDNISATRPIVVAVHEKCEQRSGFDIGKHGAIFWVVQPVFQNDEYIGAIEFGVEVKQLETVLAASLNCEVTSVLKGNAWQKAELIKHGFQEHGDYVLMTRGNTLFDEAAGQLDFVNLEDQNVNIAGKQYVLHICTLLNDFNNESIGRLVLFQNISQEVLEKKSFIQRALILTFLLLVFSFVILYYSFGTLIGRLEDYARENKRAKDDLQQAHDTLEERVKERTVELARSNASLEEEITIRSRAEVELVEQRKFLEVLIESLGHPLYVIDVNSYQVILANKAACKFSGAQSYHGMTCYAMTHHGSEPCGGSEHPCPLVEVKRTNLPVTVDHVHLDQDNNELNFEIHAYPMFDTKGNLSHVIEYNLDVTDRRKSETEREALQTQLFASQKMEAVGVLAGGVAHDFNNILTTILGYSQIMVMTMEEEHPMRSMIEDIHEAAERAAGLTRQLLAFSRKQVMEMTVASLNAIVENISRMLTRLISEDIEMRLKLSGPIGNVKVDIGQIEQVIMNLVINAKDAMPNGGQLTIETGQLELDAQYTAKHMGVEAGTYAVLTVTDNGQGMAPEVQEKIFEPFFTTKKRGKGTGLGLATVYGIVRQHNGHIYVYSEQEKGTTFKIYLPVVEQSVEEISGKKSSTMPLGNETLMIVEDDEAIRHVISDILSPLGYIILEAASGEDALALLGRAKEKIDLMLTDLIMPGINGKELIEKLQKERPEMKFILMSGYTDDIVADRGALEPGVEFINKPLLPISLTNKIREVLDAKQA